MNSKMIFFGILTVVFVIASVIAYQLTEQAGFTVVLLLFAGYSLWAAREES